MQYLHASPFPVEAWGAGWRNWVVFQPFSLDPQEHSALSENNVDDTNHSQFPHLPILHQRFFKVKSPLAHFTHFYFPSTSLRYGRLLGSSSSFKVCTGDFDATAALFLTPSISPFSYADFQDLDSFDRAHVRCGVWRRFRCSSGYLLYSMDSQVS